jgi:hypothetical protein
MVPGGGQLQLRNSNYLGQSGMFPSPIESHCLIAPLSHHGNWETRRSRAMLRVSAATFGGFFRHLNFAAGSVHGCLQRGHSQLLPSVSFSAPARIEPAQPFRICRYMLSISLNYSVSRAPYPTPLAGRG